jgi:hypothetical protein
MSEERILKLVSEEKGDQAAKGMNTIGTRAGERLRARNTKERFTPRFDGFYQGRAAARA